MRDVLRAGGQMKVLEEVLGSCAPWQFPDASLPGSGDGLSDPCAPHGWPAGAASPKLVELLDGLGLAAFVVDHADSTESIEVTSALEGLLGSPSDELSCLDDLLASVLEPWRAAVDCALKAPVGSGSTLQIPLRLDTTSGSGVPATLSAVWLGSARATRLVGAIGLASGELPAEPPELAESYRALAEVSPDIILVHQDGEIVYANRAAKRHARCPSDDCLVGMPVLDFLSPESRVTFAERLAAMALTNRPAQFAEEKAVALDGTEFDIEATSIATVWRGRPAFQAVARVITERKEAERKLRAQAALVDAISDAVVVAEGTKFKDLLITSWSRGAEEIFGRTSQQVVGSRLSEVFVGSEQLAGPAWKQLAKRGRFAHEADLVRGNGEWFPAHLSISLLRDESGQATGCILLITDVTVRKATEAAHRELQDRHSAVVAALDEGVLVIAGDGKVEFANAAAERILHLKGPAVGCHFSQMRWSLMSVDGKALAASEWPAVRTVMTGEPTTNEVCGVATPEGAVWISVNSRALSGPDDSGSYPTVCSITDVTETKSARERLAHAATHDHLTGLPNRLGMEERMRRLAGDHPGSVAVLFADLDSFKYINDSLGHGAGDAVLALVAGRLSALASREGFEVGRLGGDEFVVVCPGVETAEAALAIAGSILEQLRFPTKVSDAGGVRHSVALTASLGAAIVDSAKLAGEGFGCADLAMYAAKQAGGNRAEIFDDDLRVRARERQELREDLSGALARGELHVVYQPIVNRKRKVTSYEALLRWKHPIRGDIPPSTFIPVAEEAGLIVEIGSWVLDQAADAAVRWGLKGHKAGVSVNLSGRQVSEPGLADTVRAVLERTGLEPSALYVEVTESSLIQNVTLAAEVLADVKSLGVGLAIDDFGTGYSSLSYLDQLPFDVLKIDMSFVSAIQDAESDCTLVSGIVSLAHSLGLSVVSEGVETAEQAAVLTGLGVDLMQGYLFGRPGEPPG